MSNEKQVNVNVEDERKHQKIEFGVRHAQAILTFLSFGVAYLIRTSMSVAVLALTDVTRENDGVMIFHWDKKIQDYLLSSFFIGYVLMQVPGGQLAYKVGGNVLISWSLLLNGVLSLLLPQILYLTDWKGAIACRMLQGFTQSIMLPSIHSLIGKWAPPNERNRFGVFVISGANVGTFVGMYGSGKLASSSIGWPLIFYIVGVISIVTGCCTLLLGAGSPADHKRISDKERKMIQESLDQTHLNFQAKKPKTPWKKILTSVPLYALLTVHIGSAWGFLLMLTETPSFFKMALGINVENSAALSSLPPLITWITALMASWCADWIINKKFFKLTTVKKIFSTIGNTSCATALIGISFISKDQINLAVVLVIMINALDGLGGVGFMINHVELSPNYAGIMMGFTNSIAVGICTLAPITVGYILTDVTDITQWRLVFWIAACFYFFTNIVFLIFGTSERQPWDNVQNFTEDKEDNELKPQDEPFIKNGASDESFDKNLSTP